MQNPILEGPHFPVNPDILAVMGKVRGLLFCYLVYRYTQFPEETLMIPELEIIKVVTTSPQNLRKMLNYLVKKRLLDIKKWDNKSGTYSIRIRITDTEDYIVKHLNQ